MNSKSSVQAEYSVDGRMVATSNPPAAKLGLFVCDGNGNSLAATEFNISMHGESYHIKLTGTGRPTHDARPYYMTVDGIPDVSKEREAGFWRNLNASGGITDSQVRDAFARFKSTLDDFEAVLDERPYLMGAQCSLADIAWYIYGRRLIDAGYPLAELHPNVFSWFTKLHADENFRREVPAGSAMSLVTVLLHGVQKLRRSTLMDVVRQDSQSLFNQRQIR